MKYKISDWYDSILKENCSKKYLIGLKHYNYISIELVKNSMRNYIWEIDIFGPEFSSFKEFFESLDHDDYINKCNFEELKKYIDKLINLQIFT